MKRLEGNLLVAEKENLAPPEPRMMRAPSRETLEPGLERHFFFPGGGMKHMVGRRRKYDIERKPETEVSRRCDSQRKGKETV
jgi:hypothetical protein